MDNPNAPPQAAHIDLPDEWQRLPGACLRFAWI